jgi:FecR protein
MRKQWFLESVMLLGFIGFPLGAQQSRSTVAPGTVNYLEGQVSIDGNAISETQIGHATLLPNQAISTGNGKAEILLSPGVFVRVGDNSEVRMVSPQLVDPQVEVVRGEAMVEVDWQPKDARVDVLEHGARASILKAGLYKFDGTAAKIEVIDGKIQVTDDGQIRELGKGKELVLNAGAKLKPVSFDAKSEDDLYRWSNVRAGYLAEANAATAQGFYYGNGYVPFWGTGWYWNPGYGFYSWLPGDGYFYSPFGYPFFSPGYIAFVPSFGRFGYGYRGGFPGRGFVPRGSVGFAARAGGGGFHGGGGRR